MRLLTSLLALALGVVLEAPGATGAGTGRTLTSWDCCKPACAWTQALRRSKATGNVKVCGKDNSALSASRGASEASSCSAAAGNAYLCSDYAPRPMADDWSYAFAITNGTDNCCKCYDLQWTDGPSAGKRIVVQIINEGGSIDQNGNRDFILLMPGGGVGPNQAGCQSQFGGDWGSQYGGVKNMSDCESLPDPLQGGCYWRFNWARGVVNNWNLTYSQITCPDYLAQTSGCKTDLPATG